MSTLKVNKLRDTAGSADAITLDPNGGAVLAGVTTVTSVKVGAAVTISESGIEASGIGITCANINGGQIAGRRNLIINGDFRIAQRGTSSTSDGYHTVDRFYHDSGNNNESPTFAQVDVSSGDSGENPYAAGITKAFRITNGNQTSGAQTNSYARVHTVLEAGELRNSGWNYTSSSSFITLSFYVKASVAQNYYGMMFSQDGTTQSFSFETGTLTANTWKRVTVTAAGTTNIQFDDNAKQGFYIYWWAYNGTDYSASSGNNFGSFGNFNSSARTPDNTTTWWTTNDATFEVTGIQLEVGSEATPFEHRHTGEELSLCQRYYQKHSGDVLTYYGNGNIDGGNQAQILITFPTEMRVAPSSLDTSGTASDYFIRVTTNATCTSVPTLSTRTTKNALVEFFSTSHGFTSGHSCFGRRANVTDSFLGFSAEL